MSQTLFLLLAAVLNRFLDNLMPAYSRLPLEFIGFGRCSPFEPGKKILLSMLVFITSRPSLICESPLDICDYVLANSRPARWRSVTWDASLYSLRVETENVFGPFFSQWIACIPERRVSIQLAADGYVHGLFLYRL